ncbi:MAG: SurA N-terminal domain-containing protein [Candidatus Omnitrophota bacterium]|nr:SurA N-terminal domain-containing protein [Candidatus Omnitrophota bacterium]
MLKQLRKKGNVKKILWFLAIIIVPAFMLWGSGSLIRSQGKENYAGRIFGKKISFEEFNDSLQAVKTQAIMQFGDDFYKIQKFLNLEQETWNRLILLHEVIKRKIKIKDAEVIEAIKKLPFFKENGKFDSKIYEDILRYNFHLPARTFEEQTRHSLSFAKLFEEVTQNINIEDSELLNEYKKVNEKLRLSYFLFTPSQFEKNITIDAIEIKDYFEQHKEDFKKPPSINIQYLGIDFSSKLEPQEKRTIKDKLNEVYEELKNNPDFEKAALKFFLPIKETGFFSQEGPIPTIGWSNEFLKTAFRLKLHEICPALETPKGIYILKLKEKKDSYIPTLAEAEPDVKKILTSKKAIEIAGAKAKEALEKIKKIYQTARRIDFVRLSKLLSLELKNTPLFKYGDYIPNIGVAKEFQEAAFKLKDSKSKMSDIIALTQGFCILKLEDYQKIDEKKFVQEKEEFRKVLLEKKRKDAFNNFFEKLRLEARLQSNIPEAAFK